MPRIPIITAQQAPGQLALPRPTEEQFGGQVARPLMQFGQRLGQIAAVLQDQQDDISFSKLQGDWRAGIARINVELAQNPDFPRHPELFQQRVNKLENDLRKTIDRRPVRQAFDSMVNQTLPVAQVESRTQALQLWNDQLIADLDRQEAEKSREFGEVADVTARNRILDEFNSLVASRASRGVISQQNAQARRDRFEQRGLAERMQFLRRVDRQELYRGFLAGEFNKLDPSTRVNIIEQAQQDDERVERAAERAANAQAKRVLNLIYGQANEGTLPQDLIDRLARGEVPGIDAKTARAIQEANDNPITGGNLQAVREVMQWYYSDVSSEGRIEEAWRRSRQIIQEADRPNKALLQFMNELQTDQRTMTRDMRVLLNDDIRLAQETYDASVRVPTLIPEMARLARARRTTILARVNRRLRKGYLAGKLEDPEKLIQDELMRMREHAQAGASVLQSDENAQRFADELDRRGM